MFTLLVLSEPCRFFSTRTIFTHAGTTSPKVPARVKILVRHGRNLVRTGYFRLFTLQILSQPNPFLGTGGDRFHFHPSRAKIFCRVNRAQKGDVTRDDWQRRFSAQHTLQCWNNVVTIRNDCCNVVLRYRRCESSLRGHKQRKWINIVNMVYSFSLFVFSKQSKPRYQAEFY